MSSGCVHAVIMMMRVAASAGADGAREREAVQPRQHHVEEHQVRRAALRLRKPLVAARGLAHVGVAGADERHREEGADGGVILDDEHARLGAAHGAAFSAPDLPPARVSAQLR